MSASAFGPSSRQGARRSDKETRTSRSPASSRSGPPPLDATTSKKQVSRVSCSRPHVLDEYSSMVEVSTFPDALKKVEGEQSYEFNSNLKQLGMFQFKPETTRYLENQEIKK
ncbi:unnamed protein product [Urochloa humidicola]